MMTNDDHDGGDDQSGGSDQDGGDGDQCCPPLKVDAVLPGSPSLVDAAVQTCASSPPTARKEADYVRQVEMLQKELTAQRSLLSNIFLADFKFCHEQKTVFLCGAIES